MGWPGGAGAHPGRTGCPPAAPDLRGQLYALRRRSAPYRRALQRRTRRIRRQHLRARPGVAPAPLHRRTAHRRSAGGRTARGFSRAAPCPLQRRSGRSTSPAFISVSWPRRA
ncbi:MAG: hypothetical protein MZW92_46860 [Comamonadaceae bacterium]|nr:hypothetical protein [Comamonadaceae bacterium]